MSEKNIETLRTAHNAFSKGINNEASNLVANSVNFTDHGRNLKASSREEFLGWLNNHKSMSSNMQIVDAKYISQGDWVTAMFRVVGVNDGPSAFPVTNKEFFLDVCEVWHFNSEGQADEGHNYSDGIGLMSQLGLMPPSA